MTEFRVTPNKGDRLERLIQLSKRGPNREQPRNRNPFTSLVVPNRYESDETYIFEPRNFDEYVGQERAKDLAQIIIGAADKEGRILPNILISGSYGLGKTTLAKLILDNKLYVETTGTTVNNSHDLSGYVLIDEIHNLKPDVCDSLNPLLDSGRLRIIGCTTNPGLLPGPFRSRFRSLTLTPYTVDDLMTIQYNVIERKGTISAKYNLLRKIAERGRNTPRRTLQYLAFVMDLMTIKDEGVLTEETIDEAFDKLGVDNLGLTEIDHRYLGALPDDRAVGLQYLSAVLQVDKDTIEQEIEPYLLQRGLIDRSSKGRYKIATLELVEIDEAFTNG